MEQHRPQWDERLVYRRALILKEWSVSCSCGNYRADWTSAWGALENRFHEHKLAKEGSKRKRRR